MGEDSDDHRGVLDRGNDFQAAATIRAVFDVDIEDAFERSAPNSLAPVPADECPLSASNDKSRLTLPGRPAPIDEQSALILWYRWVLI